MSEVRVLVEGDEPLLERFLRAHADTTMFLRSNLHLSGIVHTGEPYTADYAGAFEGGELVAVAAHSWGGNLLVEAPRDLEAVAREALAHSGRGLAGIVGSRDQVEATRRALGLSGADATLDSCEDLFALDLARLTPPAELQAAGTRCRAPAEDELPLLTRWRIAYEIEALGASDRPELRRACHSAIRLYQRDGRHWLLEEDGKPVSYSAFNAQLPDCVQIGGVYTPPELRSGRRARSVVAGSLLLARARGVTRSLLFTATDNHAAQRAYRALGYERVGDYGIVHFAEAQQPG
jgi:GNAT superfamily N-acetyltransferase